MTARGLVASLVGSATLAGALPADAHTTSTGLLTLSVSGAAVQYHLTLVAAELPDDVARLLGLAADGDAASVERVATELRRRITVRADAAACRPGRATVQGSRVGDSRVVLDLTLACPAAPVRLSIRDDWFDLFGEHYRTLARIEAPGGVREAAFLPDAREVTIEVGADRAAPHGGFFRLGVEHILTGYDHLLFLAALLLRGGRPLSLLKIITAFTLAHSITLGVAVLGLASIPDRVVESVIAASIVWVAIENVVRSRPPSRRWRVSFLFGLVHGFGFAAALTPLRLPQWNLGLALVGFNLGVEAGQAFIVLLFLPVLLWLRSAAWESAVVRIASLVVAGLGMVWVVERLFLA